MNDLSHNQKQKRRSWKSKQPMQVKMGHGGTLDPMATGVLIIGVGNGTKSLNSFLECTKSYECVVLFGAATDSYDAVGKIVARKDYSHITKELVEQALEKFRGKIMQKPPIFSALKVNGKKMYEYAREGKELPIEIEARPVEVKKLEMVEWMDEGEHEFRWPVEEAEKGEKEVVDKVLKLEDGGADTGVGRKRKRENVEESSEVGIKDEPVSSSPKCSRSSPEPVMSGALPSETANAKPTIKQDGDIAENKPEAKSDNKHEASPPVNEGEPATIRTTLPRCPAPAVRLRMTVTSGFYVRSLAHDLGAAVGSLGLMSSLVRTRQGDFALGGGNVLEYEDLGKGEEVWGEQVEGMLRGWESKGSGAMKERDEERGARTGGVGKNGEREKSNAKSPKRRRRNSSSPESEG